MRAFCSKNQELFEPQKTEGLGVKKTRRLSRHKSEPKQ